MKYIVENGVTSKNVPPNSKDAILLTMVSNFASGMATSVFYTADKQIVIASYEQIGIISQGSGSLENNTFREIAKHNIGSKVKHHCIITLDTALNMFKNTTKLFLIDIPDNLLQNPEFLEKFITTIYNYPTVNIYIKGNDPVSLEYLNTLPIKCLIGINVNRSSLTNLNRPFNFFALTPDIINNEIITDKTSQNKDIFIDNVTSLEQIRNIHSTTSLQEKEMIYIITRNIGKFISAGYLTCSRPR